MEHQANTESLNLEALKKRDYIILVDKSGSMSERDCPNNMTRWMYMQEEVLALTRKALEWDDNGITVGVFNNKWKFYENVNSEDVVKKIFTENEPSGTTNTAGVLNEVLNTYLNNRANAKPITVVVATDGQPDSKDELRKTIIHAANTIERDEEIGISFVQIGKNGEATAFLKELDDDLQGEGAKFDIVDCVTCDEMGDKSITDILVGAVCD